MSTWTSIVLEALQKRAKDLAFVYNNVAILAPDKTTGPNWQAKVRQTLQLLGRAGAAQNKGRGLWVNIAPIPEIHCNFCFRKPQENRKGCPLHLARQARKDSDRTIERNGRGLCRDCDNKKLRGNIRCRDCRTKNQLKCNLWTQRHPDRKHRAWLVRKNMIDQGICICPARTPLTDGFRRCKPCRDRSQRYKGKNA